MKCVNCSSTVWWSFPRPEDECPECGMPVGKIASRITNVRSAESVTQDVLSWWNGSYFHPDEVIYEVKQIDRRYSGAAVRREILRLMATGAVKQRKEGRVLKYGWDDPLRPQRPYWGGEESEDPTVRRQQRPLEPHEDIVPMDPWEGEGK